MWHSICLGNKCIGKILFHLPHLLLIITWKCVLLKAFKLLLSRFYSSEEFIKITDNKVFRQQAVMPPWRQWHIYMCLTVLSHSYTSVMRGDRRASAETFTPAKRGHAWPHLTKVVHGSIAKQHSVCGEARESSLLIIIIFHPKFRVECTLLAF